MIQLLPNSILLQAATATPNPVAGGLLAGFSSLEILLLSLGVIVFLAGIGSLLHLSFTLMKMQQIRLLEKYHPEVLQKVGMPVPDSVTTPWWKKLFDRLTDRIPMEKEEAILLDHSYDGVMELDNNLPPWWKGLFYLTIAFAPVYLWFNHFSDFGKSSGEAYAIEMQTAQKEVKAYLATQENTVDESNVTLLADGESLEKGRIVFGSKCAVCHGKLGEGGIGPNLTDVYWLHGGGIADVFKSIKYGIPEKGMIAWKSELRPRDMQEIASYIISMQGTDPPNAKEPQGEVYEEAEAEVKAEAEEES